MPRPPLRARIAPIALALVFIFVVVGFLRADREMIRAEEDRAALMASESAALVEAFLFRHSDQLRAVQQSMSGRWRQDSVSALRAPIRLQRDVTSSFSELWVVDSTGVIRQIARLAADIRGPTPPLTFDTSATSVISHDADVPVGRLMAFARSAPEQPSVFIGAPRATREHRLLYFAQPSLGSTSLLVGVVTLDSLTVLLERQKRAKPFHITVQSSVDTILEWQNMPGRISRPVRTHAAIPSQANARRVEHVIATPFDSSWTLTMLYAPAGRGLRITLWVVGLAAVIGLGVGLLLERREASRIADRSSELEHLSTELLRANRAKSEFLANVSHELRTPLNAIVGFVDLLRDGVYGTLNPRQVGPVERIEASANHLRHLVDQILDLAKMAAGRLEVHTEPVELRPFVFDVASEVEPLITEKGLSFSLAVGATLPRVRTDPTHLRQILINLLGNAVKFTASGGISVRGKLVGADPRPGLPSVITAATALLLPSSRPEGLWIALQVVDSGIGIPEKDRERIFDEFEQVNAGPRGDSMRRGTGLGLSISRRLARLIGGDITVESEVGRGSVFTVWLPVDPADMRGDRAA